MTDKKPGMFDIGTNDIKAFIGELSEGGFKSLDKNVLSKCENPILRTVLRNVAGAIGQSFNEILSVQDAKILNQSEKPALTEEPKVISSQPIVTGQPEQQDGKYD